MSILYSYDADTQHAKVYSRQGDGGVLCDVTGVDLYVGGLLSNLAEEAHRQGYELGRRDALKEIANHVGQALNRLQS